MHALNRDGMDAAIAMSATSHWSRATTMTGPQVLVREDRGHGSKTPPLSPSAEAAWSFLGLTGVVFYRIGSADQLLAFVPLTFGTPEWEFGTISKCLDSMPLPALGLTLFMASGMAVGSRWRIRIGSVLLILSALVILGLLVIYATNVPLALKAVTEPVVRLGLKKAIVKSIGQGIGYPIVFLVMAFMAFKQSRIQRA
jgi:hypothetical protein